MTSPTPLTIDEFKAALPDKVKKSISPTLIAQINKTFSDPDMYESYRDNLLSYAKVMSEGKFQIQQYLNAVKYVSFKLMGKTSIDSFTYTFPDKIKSWAAQGVVPKDVASYVTAYNKSKLVNLIMEQSMVPTWVLNQDLFQKALNTQAELMWSAKSEKVRSDAANSLLTHLKPPETQKVELNVGIKPDGSIAKLREATMELVAQQRRGIESGASTTVEVAHSRVVSTQDGQPDDE